MIGQPLARVRYLGDTKEQTFSTCSVPPFVRQIQKAATPPCLAISIVEKCFFGPPLPDPIKSSQFRRSHERSDPRHRSDLISHSTARAAEPQTEERRTGLFARRRILRIDGAGATQ